MRLRGFVRSASSAAPSCSVESRSRSGSSYVTAMAMAFRIAREQLTSSYGGGDSGGAIGMNGMEPIVDVGVGLGYTARTDPQAIS